MRNLAQTEVHIDSGQKRYLNRDPIMEVWFRGGGSQLKVHSLDFYPENVCI